MNSFLNVIFVMTVSFKYFIHLFPHSFLLLRSKHSLSDCCELISGLGSQNQGLKRCDNFLSRAQSQRETEMEMDHFNAMFPSEWSYWLGGWPWGHQLYTGVQRK